MVEPRRKLRIGTGSYHAYRDNARDIARNRKGNGAGEEDSSSQPRRLVEVGVSGRERHESEKRTQSGARLRNIDRKRMRPSRNHGSPLTDSLKANAVQNSQRRRACQIAELDRHEIQKRRKRYAEKEICRREQEYLRAAPSEKRPWNGKAQPYEAKLLKPQLHTARTQKRQAEERGA